MRREKLIRALLTTTCLSLVVGALSYGADTQDGLTTQFEWLTPDPGVDTTRVDALGKAIDFQKWPQTEPRRVAPKIDNSLLARAHLVRRESASYTHVQFRQAPWGTAEWSAQSLVDTNEPLPTELPPERKARLLLHLSPERQNDPNFVQEYLKRKLDRYILSKRYRNMGEIDVQVCLAPSSRAAQEYLLVRMTQNSMTTEGLVMMYAAAERPQELGTVSFLTESRQKNDVRVKFVWDNVFVNVRANGCFAAEVVPVARNIHGLIKKQPALTYEQLLARRPTVMIAPDSVKAKGEGRWTVAYDVLVPAGQEIVDVKAYVDGQNTWTRDGKIHIVGKKGQVKVQLTATTSELLTGTCERECTIPE